MRIIFDFTVTAECVIADLLQSTPSLIERLVAYMQKFSTDDNIQNNEEAGEIVG